MTKKSGGLARLEMRASEKVQQVSPVIEIPLELIDFDPNQPRIAFHAPDGIVAKSDEEALAELAASIKTHGLIHPITVSEKPDGRYLVRVGERRTRASLLLAKDGGKNTISAQVRNNLTGMGALALQLAENEDRQSLTDLEIALTIKRFVTKSEENPEPMTKKEAAELLGRSAGYVTRYLAFVDDVLREKWILPGYIETVEILYQVSTLKPEIQELAYAELSTGRTERPLSWSKMKYYQNLQKNLAAQAAEPRVATSPSPSGVPAVASEPVQQIDAIAAALQSAGPDGVVSGVGNGAPVIPMAGGVAGGDGVTAPTTAVGAYTLDPEQQSALQVPTFQSSTSGSGGPTAVRHTQAVMPNTAAPCKMSVGVLNNLIAQYGDKLPEMLNLVAEVRFSSGVAVNLVRELTGESVPEDTVVTKLAAALKALQD